MAQQQDWNNAYESTPNLGTTAFLLAGEITSTRYNTRRIIGKEHHFKIPEEGGTYALQGVHKQGSAKAYTGTSAPLTRPDGTPLDDNDKGTLWIDETGGGSVLKYYKGSGQGMVPVRAELTGMIAFFPKLSAPPGKSYVEWGWLPCDGRIISVNPNDTDAAYKGPELAPLIAYLNGPNASKAQLPEMMVIGQVDGMFVRCSGKEENGTSMKTSTQGHLIPNTFNDTVKGHTHTIADTAVNWTSTATLYYTTLNATQLEDSGKDRYLYAGQHSHRVNDPSLSNGNWSTLHRFHVSSMTGTKHLYSTTEEYIPGQSKWDDSYSHHQHIIKIDKTTEFRHGHTVSETGGTETRPKGIYLFPFIHI